jgi:O-antigen ligase
VTEFHIHLVAGAIAIIAALGAMRATVYGIYGFIFLSAITKAPEWPIVGDRLVTADFLMAFTLLLALGRGQLTAPAPQSLRSVDELATLFILLATFSSVLAAIMMPDPTRTLMFAAIYIYGYCCFRLIIRTITTWDRFRALCVWWLAGASMIVVIGFLSGAKIYAPEWSIEPVINRTTATMKYAAQIPSYLGPAIFIMFFLATAPRLKKTYQVLGLGLLGASAFVLLGAGTRTGFVILVFCFVYGVGSTLAGRMRVRRGPLLVAATAGAIAFMGFAVSVWTDTSQSYSLVGTSPFERALRIFSETSRNDDAGVSEWGGTRSGEIALAVEALPNHPFFGTGSGMFSTRYQSNEIHNTYFTILAENGLIAFTVFMLWYLAIWQRLFLALRSATPERKLMFRFILGGVTVLMLYQMTLNGMRQRPFWFVPAVALSAAAIAHREKQADRPAYGERFVYA